MERRVAEQSIVRSEPESMHSPFDERQRVAMGEHDSFRSPGRSRRIKDVGEIRLTSGRWGVAIEGSQIGELNRGLCWIIIEVDRAQLSLPISEPFEPGAIGTYDLAL